MSQAVAQPAGGTAKAATQQTRARGRGARARAPAACVAAALWLGFAPAGPVTASGAASLPLRFQSERIRLAIGSDSLEVDGVYRFSLGSDRGARRIFYPFPVDGRLGGARMLRMEVRVAGGAWAPLSWVEVPGRAGVVWDLAVKGAGVVEVRAVYRQHLRGNYARYIVTTTAGWGAPLDSARFEITLPRGARALRFSYPFRDTRRQGRRLYVFEARDFLPDRDVEFEWRP